MLENEVILDKLFFIQMKKKARKHTKTSQINHKSKNSHARSVSSDSGCPVSHSVQPRIAVQFPYTMQLYYYKFLFGIYENTCITELHLLHYYNGRSAMPKKKKKEEEKKKARQTWLLFYTLESCLICIWN